MAEPLKNHFDARIPRVIARQIEAVWPNFRSRKFLEDVLSDYDDLELMDRGRSIGRALARHLPEDYPAALAILMKSIAAPRGNIQMGGGMASFFYLPHTSFVAEFGLEHFDLSMSAQHKLTQVFTAEFSVRPFIDRYPKESLALLREWADDPSPHVRRLVSEGTRPRLPWGGRLRRFQKNPAPVLSLLELLKDDPELYVRRSVANNLNDIGKDHPEVLLRVATRWMKGATPERQALVRHALRSLVKAGNLGALSILGYGADARVRLENIVIEPARVKTGGRIVVSFDVRSASRSVQRLLLDLRVQFMKANGKQSPKVFKLKSVQLAPGQTAGFRKTVSLADLTTRKHHTGRHDIEALVNGKVLPLGVFHVL